MTPKRHHGVLAPTLLLLTLCLTSVYPAQLRQTHATSLSEGLESPGWQEHSVTVECTKDDMIISVSPKASGVSFLDNDIYSTESSGFSGSIYPRGLGRAGGCLTKYRQAPGPVTYRLPLRACNTMPYTMDDGSVEYRNVLMVQPHPRLVTGLGRAHHVTCRPPAPPHALALDSQPKAARLSDVREYHRDIDVSSQPTDGRPAYSMKILKGDPALKEIATNVKIGDPLTLVISIDKELGKYGIRVTDCTVKDGLGWASQNLLNDDGCPLDTEIMGMFYYSADGSQASVTFQAHKFPYTASVYYQCAVKLCGVKDSKQCEPACGGKNQIRARRQADENETPAKIEVFSGLFVNEATDSTPDTDFVTKEKNPEDAICISQRNFAIAICIAGLILMLAVVTAILVILARRRGTKSVSNTGSSIYSGPYTNTGYSHDS